MGLSRTEVRHRRERLDAAEQGALAELAFDAERMLFRIAREDERLVPVCKLLLRSVLHPEVVNIGHQTFSELSEPPMIADYAAVAPGAATETVLWTPNASTQPHTALPANFLTRPGQAVKLRAGGIMTVPGTAGTTTFNPRWGTTTSGVALGASVAIAAGTISQTNIPWIIQFHGMLRGVGAAATFVGLGTYESNGVARDGVFGGTTATSDTTTAQGIVFGVTMSVASYSYTPKMIALEVVG
jgi:hypothetical protein